jgi:outer membrane protein assembly factor BamA
MPAVIDRAFVEDATLVLLGRARDDGFLNAKLHARFQMRDGPEQQFSWTNGLEMSLPREFAAKRARFRLQSGARFYYASLEFEGTQAIPAREAAEYFVSGDMLLRLRRHRVFTPAGLQSSMAALREAYARKGLHEAVVETAAITRDDTTGAVRVKNAVQEGRPTFVRNVNVEVMGTNASSPGLGPRQPNPAYSRQWQQQLAQRLQTGQFVQGHPDATVQFTEQGRETNAAGIQLDLLARVEPGPLVHLGEVSFEGNQRVRTSALERRVHLKEGEPLNRVEAEKSRQRIARLGVFDSVGLRYEAAEAPGTRDVIYELQEGKPISLSLLGGYGSYELLRGGLEFQHGNAFGLAHTLRLRGQQSFKATRGDFLYNIPEVFGENVSVFFLGSGLRREEISFVREELGASAGVQKHLTPIQTDLALRYDYELLSARDFDPAATNRVGVPDARAAAIVIELNRDRRDNPLLPRRGSRLFARMEFASASLGGNVDYQRFIFGGSQHFDLGGGRLLHFGLTHGVSFTHGGDPDQLPFNKRFFPGGESTVRGYQEGEASPLDEFGDQLGAETYTVANLEFEQLLTKAWSVVTFFDAVGFAHDRGNYPWDEELYSVGAGIRWRSLLGPVRLEYGYNLNRRTHDPSGTLHFSIGFPF